MTSEKTAKRRRYSAEFKAQVVAQCDAPGASVAKVAMSHGINANVVHGWRQLSREGAAAAVVPREFIPLRVQAAHVQPVVQRDIELELRRGAMTMKITWPRSASADFAAWTRELLR